MSRIYISGPMTGVPLDNYPAFIEAARVLRSQSHTVANPAEICLDDDTTWEEYLKADIKALCDCDTIAMLPGWEKSKGAHLELHIAHRVGMQVMFL